MPMDIIWAVKPHILYINIYGIISIDDSLNTDKIVRAYLDNTEHPIHLLQNIQHVDGIHFNWRAMTNALTAFRHPKLGVVVNIWNPKNTFVRVASEFFNRALNITTYNVDSYEDASVYFRKTLGLALPTKDPTQHPLQDK